jgi:hypothetical protein
MLLIFSSEVSAYYRLAHFTSTADINLDKIYFGNTNSSVPFPVAARSKA